MKKHSKNKKNIINKTELGKNSYKKLTISLIILITLLIGLALTIYTGYYSCNNIKLVIYLLPIFIITSMIVSGITCYYLGQVNGIVKSYKK